jgi:TatD DNase family protein
MDHFKHVHVVPGSVDSHFHLAVMEEKELPVAEIMDRSFADGLRYALDIATRPDDLKHRRSLAAGRPGILHTVGVHPSGTGQVDPDAALPQIESLLGEPDVVALGEIGLDWHWNFGSPQEQKRLFIAQLELARRRDTPVIIHNRDAEADIYDIVSEHRPPANSIMHCFSADAAYARRFLDLGFLISFAGNVTFKKRAEHIQEAARIVPLDRMLLETDSAFLAPEPARGRPNHPGYVGHVYEFVARQRGIAVEDLSERVRSNFGLLLHGDR